MANPNGGNIKWDVDMFISTDPMCEEEGGAQHQNEAEKRNRGKRKIEEK